jgi:hypothetical protein
MSLSDVITNLFDALDAISPQVRTYTDPGANIDPPGIVIGLPDIVYDTYGGAQSPTPIEATLTLYLMVKESDRSTSDLSTLISQVVDTIWTVADYSVTDAKPGIWTTSNVQLPAYVLTVVGPAN